MGRLEQKVFESLKSGKINDPSDEIFDILEQNKLLGYFKESYPEQFKGQWVLNMAYIDLLKEIKVPPHLSATILKGAHLINTVYPSEGLRFMGDVDLLISKDSMSDWKHYLTDIGFKDITGETWSANQFKSLHLRNQHGLELVIELHTRLFYQENADHEWETLKATITPFNYLRDEDLFVHLCGHLGYQHTFISLHWLFDIYLLLKKADLDWEKVRVKARQANVWRSCEIIIELLKRHFQFKIQLPYNNSIYSRLMTRVLINEEFLCNSHSAKIRYFLIKHFCKDSLFQALTYDFNWWRHKNKKS